LGCPSGKQEAPERRGAWGCHLCFQPAYILLLTLPAPPTSCRLPCLTLPAPLPACPPPLQLLGYIKKDKQGDSLIEKLCQRFAASEDSAQWHSIAFCLTQVSLRLLLRPLAMELLLLLVKMGLLLMMTMVMNGGLGGWGVLRAAPDLG
jgi:hypothetical protein